MSKKCKAYLCDQQIYTLKDLEKKWGSTSFMDIPMTKWPEWYKCKYEMLPKSLCQPHSTSPELKKLKMNLTRLKGELKKCVSNVKEFHDSLRTETNKLKKYKNPEGLEEQKDLINYLNMDLKNAESELLKKEGEFNKLFRDIEKCISQRFPSKTRRTKNV